MAITERSARSPRWDLMGRYQVRIGGELFLDRRRVIQTPMFAVLITRILRPDEGRDPHGHSRWFASVILSGAYEETVWDDPGNLSRRRHRAHRRWSAHVMRPEHAHVITSLRAPLRTLVIAGRHRGTWHFWTPEGPVDWREYGA